MVQENRKNGQSRNDLIEELTIFAKKKRVELAETERVYQESKKTQETIDLRRKNLLHAYATQGVLKKKTPHYEILIDVDPSYHFLR